MMLMSIEMKKATKMRMKKMTGTTMMKKKMMITSIEMRKETELR